MNELADVVKKYRKINGIPSKKLSILIGKSDAYISHLENGRNKNPDYQTIKIILDELSVPEDEQKPLLEYLLTNTEDQCTTEKFIENRSIKRDYISDTDIEKMVRREAERIAMDLIGLNVYSKKLLIELLNEQIKV